MSWEYKIIYFVVDDLNEDEYERRLHHSARQLDEFGEEGWELITFIPHRMADNSTKHHAVFKRPKAE